MVIARLFEKLFERIMGMLAVLGSGVDLDADVDSLVIDDDAGDPRRMYGS